MSGGARLFQTEDFTIEWARQDDAIEVCMWGTAGALSEHLLVGALNEVQDAAAAQPPREIRIDFRGIEFLHSGCLKYLVNWVTQVNPSAGGKYKVVLIWNPAMNWQKRTVFVLCSLAPESLQPLASRDPVRPRPRGH
jgi:hypothetical protein